MVNGIDSLDLLNNYFGNAYGLPKDIRKIRFITQDFIDSSFEITLNYGSSGLDVGISKQYVRKKNFIRIGIVQDSTLFKKNLFISKEIEWEIIRLAKTGPFKIKTTLSNGNTYEIQID